MSGGWLADYLTMSSCPTTRQTLNSYALAKAPLALAALVLLAAGCAEGGSTAVSTDPPESGSTQPTIDTTGATPDNSTATTTTVPIRPWQDRIDPAPDPLPVDSFMDGIHRVGIDVAAGERQVQGGDTCAWTITLAATGEVVASYTGADVDQLVTLEEGQKVETSGCSAWASTAIKDSTFTRRVAESMWYTEGHARKWQACIYWNTAESRDAAVASLTADKLFMLEDSSARAVEESLRILARECDPSIRSNSLTDQQLGALPLCKANGIFSAEVLRGYLFRRTPTPPPYAAAVDLVDSMTASCADPDHPGAEIPMAQARADLDFKRPVAEPNPNQWQTSFPVAPSGNRQVFWDGGYIVGADIAEGTYEAIVASNTTFDCTTRLLDRDGKTVVDEYSGLPKDGRSISLTTGQVFETDGCGLWRLEYVEPAERQLVSAEVLAAMAQADDKRVWLIACAIWWSGHSPEQVMQEFGIRNEDDADEYLSILARDCGGPPAERFSTTPTDEELGGMQMCQGYFAVGASRLSTYLGGELEYIGDAVWDYAWNRTTGTPRSSYLGVVPEDLFDAIAHRCARATYCFQPIPDWFDTSTLGDSVKDCSEFLTFGWPTWAELRNLSETWMVILRDWEPNDQDDDRVSLSILWHGDLWIPLGI
jgi:hypothetical protein